MVSMIARVEGVRVRTGQITVLEIDGLEPEDPLAPGMGDADLAIRSLRPDMRVPQCIGHADAPQEHHQCRKRSPHRCHYSRTLRSVHSRGFVIDGRGSGGPAPPLNL